MNSRTDDQYLSAQLIAYIGNKRRLIPFLREIFRKLERRNGTTRFLDPFSGSGAVSRLGRHMGYEVHANDIERYSYDINLCHIAGDLQNQQKILKQPLMEEIEYMNSLPLKKDGFFAGTYAPERINEENRYLGERLFYTPRNACFIDTVRDEINERYPREKFSDQTRSFLIAPLLYQAATHANTSGVFKAYHRGFGGHGADALSRIMKDMALQFPVLTENGTGHMYNENAADFCAARCGDICYLDPPYNQHQYGSNYHILNTIALWDKPVITGKKDSDGALVSKAGIRTDWQKTRSDFCSRPKAADALKALMENIDADHIVLSYNTDGIIPFEELIEIVSGHGSVGLEIQEYTKYRGGRQSLHRKTKNIEFQLVISRGSTHGKTAGSEPTHFLLNYKLNELLLQTFSPDRMLREFQIIKKADGNWNIEICGAGFELYRGIWFATKPDRSFIENLDMGQKLEFYEKLKTAQTKDRTEELEILFSEMLNCTGKTEIRFLFSTYLKVLRKIAHRKYRIQYYVYYERLARFIKDRDVFTKNNIKKMKELKELAEKRFQ